MYKENKGLHYGMYATAGDAFGNWGSEPTNGELMGKASNPTLVHRSLTCPKESNTCPDFDCDVDLCATGDQQCDEETFSTRPQSQGSSSRKRSIEISTKRSQHVHLHHGHSRSHVRHEPVGLENVGHGHVEREEESHNPDE
ncbi:hypothetical protein ACHAP7_010402 [Fusarium lateritium]